MAIAKAATRISWRVQSRRLDDPTVTGTVTEHLRAIRNTQGNDTHLVQLSDAQQKSAIVARAALSFGRTQLGALIGVFVEHGQSRSGARSGERTVSNVSLRFSNQRFVIVSVWTFRSSLRINRHVSSVVFDV